MKINTHWILLLLLLGRLNAKSAVTFSTSGGRLGDNLVAYLHAKYIAYKYDLEFLLIPHAHFNEFELYTNELKFSEWSYSYSIHKTINPHQPVIIDSHANILYIIPYFPDWEYGKNGNQYMLFVDWNNPEFLKEIRRQIKPKAPLDLPKLDDSKINIAIHIRRGGGFDEPLISRLCRQPADMSFPLKFPPMRYYIEQLRKICNSCKNTTLYVYIFTDDKNPISLMNELKSHIKHDNITFKCRVRGNAHNKNLMYDMFAMTKFDILIRPDSNFSIVVDKLHDFLCVIHPYDFRWENQKLYITKQKLRINSAHIKYLWLENLGDLKSSFAVVEEVFLN
ncbi:MAG: hypothetical protein AMXMBFR12_04890 [Candidatus Babeliales bacterium]